MTTDIVTYRCEPCERQFPNRKANIFGSRPAIRKHLRDVHGMKHNKGTKKHGGKSETCHCLDKWYLTIINGVPKSDKAKKREEK